MLEQLALSHQKATFFCLGWVARKHPNVVRNILSNGHELGSHTNLHNLSFLLSKKEFIEDFRISLESLEDISGEKVRYFRAPAFSLRFDNRWVFEVLVEYGIDIDCSIFPAKRDFGGFKEVKNGSPCFIHYNGLKIKELPINPFSFLSFQLVFSGGGYFRILPYKVFKYLMGKSDYVMTYFHPRDFDYNQPILKGLSWQRRIKSYYGLSRSKSKFNIMLSDFEFMDIAQANRAINWNKVPIITL